MEVTQKIKSFTELKVWQEAHKLVLVIYQITQKFPKEEIYGLTNQIRRAAISVSSNLAEGFGRSSYVEKLRFYDIAHGSLAELQNQLLIARDINYLAKADFRRIGDQSIQVHKLLNAFMKKTKDVISRF